MRPPDEVRKGIVRQWLAKAEEDVEASGTLLSAEPPLLYASCFHAQQAAEKYIKALLAWHQVEFPKTHEIEQLLDLLTPVDAGVARSVTAAAALTSYAVDTRYPGDLPDPTFAEARRALELAREVREAVLGALPLE
ncbi:MAG: HEPN domain-containing protein [Armatimonadota bacterium]